MFTEFQCKRVAGKTSCASVFSFSVKLKPNTTCIGIIKSQKPMDYGAYISLYHDIPDLPFEYPELKYQCEREMRNEWTHGKGGHYATPTFLNNPQYDLILEEKTSMMVILRSFGRAEINFHIVPIEDEKVGKRLRYFNSDDVLFDRKYTRYIMMKKVFDLAPGKYRLIASNYDPSIFENFTLHVFTKKPLSERRFYAIPSALGIHFQYDLCPWNRGRKIVFHVDSNYSNNEVSFHFTMDGEKRDESDEEVRPAIRASVYTNNGYVIRNTYYDNCMYGVFLDFKVSNRNLIYAVEVESFEIGLSILHVATGTQKRARISCATPFWKWKSKERRQFDYSTKWGDGEVRRVLDSLKHQLLRVKPGAHPDEMFTWFDYTKDDEDESDESDESYEDDESDDDEEIQKYNQ